MINQTVTINVLSEAGAISELTFCRSSGQYGTLASILSGDVLDSHYPNIFILYLLGVSIEKNFLSTP